MITQNAGYSHTRKDLTISKGQGFHHSKLSRRTILSRPQVLGRGNRKNEGCDEERRLQTFVCHRDSTTQFGICLPVGVVAPRAKDGLIVFGAKYLQPSWPFPG